MLHRFYFPFALGLLLLAFGCSKSEDPDPAPALPFVVHVHNEYSDLQARFAVFLSDEDGQIRAFRWLPSNDTAQVVVAGASSTDRLDCTVVKIATLTAPGTGVRDTTVTLTTYTNLFSDANIRLRVPVYRQSTDVTIRLNGVNSVDSVVAPAGLTFAQPHQNNNFTGQYRMYHTGQAWCRLRINGEQQWRYLLFPNLNGPAQDTVVDAGALPALNPPVTTLNLPLLTAWDIQIDRILDAGAGRFLSLGSQLPVPGNAVPIFEQVAVYEPPGLPGGGYRLHCSGFDASDYGYTCDLFSPTVPAALPLPQVDVFPTVLADKRLVAVQCSGPVDLLAFARQRSGTPGLTWEALLAPNIGGLTVYRLPDVPDELALFFPALKTYDFGDAVRVRAESYDLYNAYPEVLARRIDEADPLWQMKAGYIARERVF